MHIRSSILRITVSLFLLSVSFLGVAFSQKEKDGSGPRPQTRLYFVAADEVEWDYTPGGVDAMTGKPFEGMAKAYTERGPH